MCRDFVTELWNVCVTGMWRCASFIRKVGDEWQHACTDCSSLMNLLYFYISFNFINLRAGIFHVFCVPFPIQMCNCKMWMGRLKVQLLWLTLGIVIFVQVLIIKPTRCTNSSNLFLEWNSTCFGQFSVHYQEFLTAHTAMVYVIQVLLTAFEQDYDPEKLLMMDRGTVRSM